MGEEIDRPVLSYRSPETRSTNRSVALAIFSVCLPVLLFGIAAAMSGLNPENRNPIAVTAVYFVSLGVGTTLFALHRRSKQLLPLLIFALAQAAYLLLIGWFLFQVGHKLDIDIG